MAEVVLKHLTKRFGEVVAVNDVSLFVEDGEFIVLLGPSGCGKSTILRLIAGLEDADEGEITIGGNLINFTDPVKRDVAMVFQNYALYPHMTVYKNIAFPLQMAKKKKDVIRPAVRRAAEILELDELLDRFPDELSGGQRQRVALARAIVREPSAFLMDEPLSNLDALLRVQTRVELMRLHQRLQTTTIYVTHDQVEAMTMGHRIAVMRHGVVQQLGEPNDVYARPANVFVATFMGAPSMNILPGALARENGRWQFQGHEWTVDFDGGSYGVEDGMIAHAEGADAQFGVRPEDLRIVPEEDGILPARVQILEPVGSDLYLTADVGGTEIQVRTPPETRVSPDERVSLGFDIKKSHLFDQDGRSVRHVGSAPEATPATEEETTAAASSDAAR